MGFLSYSLGFYREELQRLAQTPASPDNLYRARQLLQMLDDLTADGYTELNDTLETAFSGVSRLRDYLRRNHAGPFTAPKTQARTSPLPYSPQEIELRTAISGAMQAAEGAEDLSAPFADRLRQFCRWVGYDEDTAYIFLLRDTLLPFVFYAARGRERIYPWLLSRSSFVALTGQAAADDVRASIYRALEAGCTEFDAFCRFVLPEMRRTLARYPQAEQRLRAMLQGIGAERILVVESGCTGTFPLLLMSLDARVDLRMYTAYPYLTGIFGPRLFTSQYEENRMFETMAAHALYFRFSGLRDGSFYVQPCTDAAVRAQALAEIRQMLPRKHEVRSSSGPESAAYRSLSKN